MPREDIVDLEARLARIHGREHCVLFARGATALHALFSIFALQGTVVMPSILCMSPAAVAIGAGCEVVFVDVRREDGNIDPVCLERLLSQRSGSLVLAPHMFGNPCRIAQIAEVATSAGAVVVEDAAQALGAETEGRLVGSFGDYALLSFGHAKILEAGGGAALLFDDSTHLETLRQHTEAYPQNDRCREALVSSYREAYYSLAPLMYRNRMLAILFQGFPNAFQDLYLQSGVSEGVVLRTQAGLDKLEANIERRRSNANVYERRLAGIPGIRLLERLPGAVPWRFSVVVDQKIQQRVANGIRARGFDASTWYPPLHMMLQSGASALPTAEAIGFGIVNLWCSPSMSENDVLAAADALKAAVEEAQRA